MRRFGLRRPFDFGMDERVAECRAAPGKTRGPRGGNGDEVASGDVHWQPMTTVKGWHSTAAVLRVTGRTSLVVGLVLLGFVAFELFVTSFFAERAQAGLTEELEGRIAAADTDVVAYEVGAFDLTRSPIEPPPDLPMPDPAAIEAALAAGGVGGDPAGAGAAGGNGAATGAESGIPEGSIVIEAPPPRSAPIGRIVIPAVGIKWTVVEGIDRQDLQTGAGHMPGTALPGQPGNAVISGHRTTYGAPFHDLGKTAKGDLITVTTASGAHVYQIVEKRIVEPSETWVTGQWEGAWLTLTTCHPKFSSSQRLIVFARLVGGPNAPALSETA